ncbi:MAG: DUF6119 family protein [Bacillota bacterium]
MPKYNIYKIKKKKQSKLIDNLKDSGLEKIENIEIDNYNLIFYYSVEPDESLLWWGDLFNIFFDDGIEKPRNISYFGVLLITSEEVCYAVSLGKAHFYIHEFCDYDFGLNLAERIVNDQSLKTKNSKYFGSRKSKTITTYQNGTVLDHDSGESTKYIKAETVNEEKWGKTVNFGYSVKFNIDKEPHNLPSLIEQIEEALKSSPKFQLPKVEKINDNDLIERLDKKLVTNILNNNENSNIRVDEFKLSGTDFIFTEKNDYYFYIFKNSRKTKYNAENLTLEELNKFIEKNDIDLKSSLERVYVHAKNKGDQGLRKNIKYFLDYVDDDWNCLMNGKWFKFNQFYIDYLENEVKNINLDDYDEKFDLNYEDYKTYLQDKDLTKNEMYREQYYNVMREDDGFINFDRNMEYLKQYSLEKMDLYKDKSLYFVKIGTPQKLSYVIDQSLNTVKLLQNNTSEIKIANETISPRNIYLWLILDRKSKISDLSDMNSLIFLAKLVEWKKETINANFHPVVKVNYLIKE